MQSFYFNRPLFDSEAFNLMLCIGYRRGATVIVQNELVVGCKAEQRDLEDFLHENLQIRLRRSDYEN